MNKEWHRRHKMGVNSPLEKRVAWHIEHEKHCGCYTMPSWMRKKLPALLKKDIPEKPLKDMSNVPYDPQWPVIFEKLQGIYIQVLPSVVAIEHVGSTAIPGTSGKPRLDIDIVIESEADLPAMISALETLGYYHQGDLGRKGREAFGRKDELVPYDGNQTTWMKHNLYVCTKDCPTLSEHIRFRDYLRSHPEIAAEYCELKMRLAEEYRHDQDAYVAGKSEFVRQILEIA